MAINQPSQYECDKAEPGDTIIIRKRNFLYRWYRDIFQKHKIKLKVRKDWTSNERIECYQEDCTLLYKWEVQGQVSYDDEIPYRTGYRGTILGSAKKLNKVKFGSENILFILHSGLTFIVPTSLIRDGLSKMDNIRNNIDLDRQVHEALKFARFKGDYFKNKCAELNKEYWPISYCSVCGDPVKIEFREEGPYVNNTCKCGNMSVKSEYITWDVVAYWFNSQTQRQVVNKYKEFWNM